MNRVTDVLEVGYRLESIAAGDRVPTGTVATVSHPVYQGVTACVRVENAFGEQWWDLSGSQGKWTTREIKQSYGWADLIVVQLPLGYGIVDGNAVPSDEE